MRTFLKYFTYFRQANVSSVYRKLPVTKPDKEQIGNLTTDNTLADDKPGPSRFPKDTKHFNPIEAIKEIKKPQEAKQLEDNPNDSVTKTTNVPQSTNNQVMPMETRNAESINRVGQSGPVIKLDDTCSSTSIETQDQLERRLTIEEEVTFVST